MVYLTGHLSRHDGIFEFFGVDMDISHMSFSVSLDQGRGCEWGTRNGISSLFAQKKNILNPFFGKFIESHGYSELFQKAYLIPICASIWTCPLASVLGFSAYYILSSFHDHHLLQLFGLPQLLTVRWRSHINKVKEELAKRGCQIITACEVNSVTTNEEGCTIACNDGAKEVFDGCIIATHAPNTLKMLGKEATYDETRILGAFQYVYSDVFLHHDKTFLPRYPEAWSAFNFLGTKNNRGCATYWLNIIQAGVVSAYGMLKRNWSILDNPKHMVSTWPETGARHIVIRFLKSFVQTGCIILLEEGGTIFNFQGTDRKCPFKVSLRVHSAQFYWKAATLADIGLADAFIHGDFSFVDKNEGLLNLILIFIANIDLKASVQTGWWTPVIFTAALSSAKYFFRHVSNGNTLTQARTNISHHYDLSNELFSLFMDETMLYSCAIFKSEDEDLKDAQLRKISHLIRKAKISKEHHLLEIGFGWGSLAIEAVKQTGCKYTGITLSEQQLKYAQLRVEQEGLQFMTVPDEMYDEHRHRTGFVREYILPGGCIPALSRITSAMDAASRLCVVHLEEIGIHYCQTLRYWRKNFLKNQSQIHSLGFDDKFIRTMEYYFDYCAASFKSRTTGVYQVVFSRLGNVATYGDPYNGVPPAY
ncbi:unnamed protein product [Withania somnifera]